MNYLIALGTNMGNRKENLHRAIRVISERCGEVVAVSSIYETPPLGFVSEFQFLNQAIHLRADLQPIDLLNQLLEIELDMGRVRQTAAGYSSRVIDLDIVMMNALILNTEQLVIPHPRMAERRFVLEPAAEVAANWIHPVSNQTISEMLAKCADKSIVTRI